MARNPLRAPLATAFIAMASLALPALAGGPTATSDETPVAEAMPAATGHDWSGLYLGLAASSPQGATAWYTLNDGGGFAEEGDWDSTQGILSLGYNIQRGQMVYGVELNYVAGALRAESREDNFFFVCMTATACVTEVTDLVELRARIGKAVDRSLFYLSGGFASASVTGLSGTPEGVNGSGKTTGYSIGLGYEYSLNHRMSLGVEYSHTSLDRVDLPIACNVCSVTPEFGSLRLGVDFHF